MSVRVFVAVGAMATVMLGTACGPRTTAPRPEAAPSASPSDAPIARADAGSADAAAALDPCALVTAEDLRDVCGFDGTLTATDGEGQTSAPTCARAIDGRGRRSAFAFTLWRTDPADAVARFADAHRTREMIRTDALDLGDRAELEHDSTAMASQTISVRVQAGDAFLVLAQFKRAGHRAPCDDDQLVTLARGALARLRP